MKPWGIGVAAVALYGLLACAASLPAVTAGDARTAGVPLQELRGARDRYVAKCSGCHRLYGPEEYEDDVWAFQVHDMTARARLTAADTAAILAYLTAMNGDTSPEVARLTAR